ncbi:MAG TPA: MBL fold metallo-hydrolase [Roseiflexaceae bacterium]|nr:MBL fold metallo-hydrolase [Roseiflexaceae bacterium]
MDTSYGLPADIRLIDDMHLGQRHVIGTYLLLGDEPAIVDPGPSSVLPALEAGLRSHGVAPEELRALVLTHIHLDHAGATGTLVRAFPHLRVYVHQRGAPHLVAPERLIRSATRIYGDQMGALWGELLPVPEANITALAGGETVQLGGRALRVYDAPGHASHHLLYLEESSGAAFVGDTAGLRMPGYRYARPATPPPDVDLEAWRRTLDTLLQLGPRMLCLTHFGPAFDVRRHLEALWSNTLRWAEVVRASLARGEDQASVLARLAALTEEELGAEASPEARSHYEQASSIEMNWRGLERYWRTRGAADKERRGGTHTGRDSG